MSFFSNFQTDKCPGPISGNPLGGLNEKVCIQAQRVFDACIKQSQSDGIVLNITDPVPANPTYPLTFISARSTTSAGVVTAFQVDRLPDRAGCARVQATVDIPVEVVYTDANGVEGKATSTVTVSEDVILFVPQPSVMPYEVQSVVSAVSPEGTFNASDNTFTVDLCITVILKIIISVDLLVPSYGYCLIPPAQEYTREVCAGFFELPLYPQGNTDCGCNGCNK
ncbi:MAG TPA: hypothetical protein H9726_07655 [Candidatus Borkfalkia avicola]|uniref:Uncharacterized protein n=1 Tax=Candidatus Borkfalkia avicola TaxID=2838503 RepID=A0A9D2IIH4_9FIRM|nr:hypothetical protein [Candidatus Borkfalkia avicola]